MERRHWPSQLHLVSGPRTRCPTQSCSIAANPWGRGCIDIWLLTGLFAFVTGSVRLKYADIRSAIVRVDDNALSVAVLEAITTNAPDNEESEALQAFKSTPIKVAAQLPLRCVRPQPIVRLALD